MAGVKIIRQIFRAFNLENSLRAYYNNYSRIENRARHRTLRTLKGTDNKLLIVYLKSHEIRKLQVGCGANALSGWLNSDYYPRSKSVLHLDATKPFPIDNQTFHFVFSEHMIEHLDYPQGLHVLNECHRILRHGGRLRISTPDLSFLMSLYTDSKSDLQKGFIKHSTDTHIPWAPCYEDTFVINNYMRDWDHRFIYDEKVLRAAMEKVGFKNVTRQDLCGSDEEELRNLENIHRKPLEFLKSESLIFEGIKS